MSPVGAHGAVCERFYPRSFLVPLGWRATARPRPDATRVRGFNTNRASSTTQSHRRIAATGTVLRVHQSSRRACDPHLTTCQTGARSECTTPSSTRANPHRTTASPDSTFAVSELYRIRNCTQLDEDPSVLCTDRVPESTRTTDTTLPKHVAGACRVQLRDLCIRAQVRATSAGPR